MDAETWEQVVTRDRAECFLEECATLIKTPLCEHKGEKSDPSDDLDGDDDHVDDVDGVQKGVAQCLSFSPLFLLL